MSKSIMNVSMVSGCINSNPPPIEGRPLTTREYADLLIGHFPEGTKASTLSEYLCLIAKLLPTQLTNVAVTRVGSGWQWSNITPPQTTVEEAQPQPMDLHAEFNAMVKQAISQPTVEDRVERNLEETINI